MVGRTLSTGMSSALAGNVIRPVLIGRLDIATDPLTAWTGPGSFIPSGTGDAALDGQIFTNLAPFIELSNVTEDFGIGGPTTLVVAGHDLNEDLLKQIVKDTRQWRGRKAWLWMGLLNADEATVVVSPVRIKTGIMSQVVVNRDGDDASVAVTIDRDLGRASSAPLRWVDHQRFWPSDLWSTYIQDLMNQPEGFTQTPIQGGTGDSSIFRGKFGISP